MLTSHWYLGHLLIFSTLCTHWYNVTVYCIPSVSFCYSPCTCRCGSFTSFTLGDPFSLCHILLFFFSGGGHSHSHDHEGHDHAHEHAHAHSLEDLSVGLSILCEYIPHTCPIVFCFMTSGFRPLDTFFAICGCPLLDWGFSLNIYRLSCCKLFLLARSIKSAINHYSS